MKRLAARSAIALVAATLLCVGVACDDGEPARADGRAGSEAGAVDGARRDSSALVDARPKDAPRRDGRGADGAVPDAAVRADRASPRRDVAAGDSAAVDAPARPDGPRRCTNDLDCRVFRDCCDCRGAYVWEAPVRCPRTCIVDACRAWGIASPVAYCVQGVCKVAENTVASCRVDSDCKRHDNCCYCEAFPKQISLPACTRLCPNRCPRENLGSYRARCLSGSCRLSP